MFQIDEAAAGICQSIVKQADGESDLASTVRSNSNDLCVEVTDELKGPATKGKGGTDGASSIAIKMFQTRLSAGVIVRWSCEGVWHVD